MKSDLTLTTSIFDMYVYKGINKKWEYGERNLIQARQIKKKQRSCVFGQYNLR